MRILGYTRLGVVFDNEFAAFDRSWQVSGRCVNLMSNRGVKLNNMEFAADPQERPEKR